jgi:hypothetical protein
VAAGMVTIGQGKGSRIRPDVGSAMGTPHSHPLEYGVVARIDE